MTKTLDYYHKNSYAFFDRTIDIDMTEKYKMFLPLLPEQAHILDLGCGSGRDSKYFLSQKFKVTAIDGSEEMVRLATEYTGLNVLLMKFQDLSFQNKFDAVWANASLLHVPYEKLNIILRKIHSSLKEDGILHMSFKHGNTHRVIEDRDFYDMDEEKIIPYLEHMFIPLKMAILNDTQSQAAPSPSQKWLHVTAKKKI